MALSSVGPAAATVHPAILQALHDPVPTNRSHAVSALARTYSLWQSGSEDHSAAAIVPELMALLRDDTWVVRSAAIQTLGRIGSDALAAWSPVEVALEDPSRNIRYLAAGVLLQLAESSGEPERAVAPLTRAHRDRDERVRITVAVHLGRVGPPASSAIPALTEALNDPSARVREATRKALQAITEPQP